MKLALCLIFSAWFFVSFNKGIKKHAPVLYAFTVLLSLLALATPHSIMPPLVLLFVNKILVRGVLQGALFILVMYVSVMPEKSDIRIKLSKVRGEMAIAASLLTLIHNISYGKRYFILLFTEASQLKPYEAAAAVLSLAMILLLIPLTLTSFQVVRKKMSGRSWKRLQRLSYVFYALLYFHIVLIFSRGILAGKLAYLADLYIYTLIFGSYAILRHIKYFKKKAKNLSNSGVLVGANHYVKHKSTVIIVVFSALILGECIYAAHTFAGAGAVKAAAEASRQAEDEKNTAEENSEKDSGKAYKTGNSEAEASAEKDSSEALTQGKLKDGDYEGSAIGYNGKLTVSVSIEEGKIKDIKVIKHSDDEEYFYDARDKVIQSILEKQSTEVDSVSGATTSADAIIKAVKRALGEIK